MTECIFLKRAGSVAKTKVTDADELKVIAPDLLSN